MIRRILKGLATAAVFLLLAGFGPGTPIYNVQSVAIPPNPAATMENIEKAVMRAGLTLGWQIVPKAPGQLEGVLVLRTHRAVVDITHDTKVFSINYKDSVNLSYSESDKTIHSNYNGWIQNLEKAIRAQVTVL
jgi:hypothetical protein